MRALVANAGKMALALKIAILRSAHARGVHRAPKVRAPATDEHGRTEPCASCNVAEARQGNGEGHPPAGRPSVVFDDENLTVVRLPATVPRMHLGLPTSVDDVR